MKIKFPRINFLLVCLLQILTLSFWKASAGNHDYITFNNDPESFVLCKDDFAAPILIDPNDYSRVDSVAHWCVNDLKMVSDQSSKIFRSEILKSEQLVLVGTIGKNRWIDQLASEGKLDVSDIKGQWERSLVQVVDHPFPNMERALVLVSREKRGTIYAMLNLSRAMGVSPWYGWADVPVERLESVYVKDGCWVTENPKVKFK